MRYFTSLAIFAALLILVAPFSAHAKTLPASLYNPSHQAKARAILARHDSAIAKALAADPVLKAAIDKDLKALAAMTDPKQRQTAITAFRASHSRGYKKVLLAAKVDWTMTVAELAHLYPGMKFRIVDGLYAVGYKDDDGTPAPPPPVRTTTDVRLSDFDMDIQQSCGAISGAGVTLSGGTLDTSVWAAEAGVCSNSGYLTYDFTVPAGATTTVSMSAELRNEVFALGILGGAASDASGFFGIDGVKTVAKFCSVFVGLAWAASEECNDLDARVSKTLQPGTYSLTAITFTAAGTVGVVSGTHARARVRSLKASLTLTQ
ncbi:hypothetical protein ABI_22650 [Asticcacaulis biprosthecium C19]|uniref:Uncharacterized protein n=1 Tax=Asticcacaulis biprosthecium C19 TaxID=715226 RepID=F4QNE5_9CAUL|nr:hypothetical protein [Asticcacaulis biprosthecium]EGF90853.1 hypothetical protein ABI_22650 [Asticcacaulis biprosthecium C19]